MSTGKWEGERCAITLLEERVELELISLRGLDWAVLGQVADNVAGGFKGFSRHLYCFSLKGRQPGYAYSMHRHTHRLIAMQR